MNWIEWLGVGLVGWVVVSVAVALAFARMFAAAMEVGFDRIFPAAETPETVANS